jgi:hypothetical protein
MPFGNAVGEGFNNGAIVVAEKVIVFGTGDGVFVYNGTPGLGNGPVFVAASPNTTVDPYGNAVDPVVQLGPASGAHISVDQFGELIVFNSAGQIAMFLQPSLLTFSVYNPPAGLGQLAATFGNGVGPDNFGNAFEPGLTSYQNGGSNLFFAISVQGGAIGFYFATSAGGPYTRVGQFSFTSTGELEMNFAGTTGVIPQPPPAANAAAIVACLQALGLCT